MTKPNLDELVWRARRERAAPGALAAVARNLRVPFIAAPMAAMVMPGGALASIAVKSSASHLALLSWSAGSAVAVTSVVFAAVALRSPVAAPAPSASPQPHQESVVLPARSAEPVATSEPLPPPASSEKYVFRSRPSSSEPQLIERARKALASQPRQALALTQEHQRRFPTGALSVERDVIALEALARSGQTAEARRRALTFEASHPGSIHLPRVRALLRRLSAQ